MNKNDTATWRQIYDDWNWAVRDFPELRSLSCCMKINITQPQYGPVYHFDWVAKGTEEEAVQEDLKILASGYPEVGTAWSRGTIKTASLLADCETEEEFAAVWLSAFALSLTRKGGGWDTTKRNAAIIEQEACSIVTKKHGYWHASSRDFFPAFYIPTNLFWESKDLSAATLVELAAINAALVMAHFTPVEYKVVR